MDVYAAFDLVSDIDATGHLQIRALLVLDSCARDWYEANGCRIRAERLWRLERVGYDYSNETFAEFRTILDNLATALEKESRDDQAMRIEPPSPLGRFISHHERITEADNVENRYISADTMTRIHTIYNKGELARYNIFGPDIEENLELLSYAWKVQQYVGFAADAQILTASTDSVILAAWYANEEVILAVSALEIAKVVFFYFLSDKYQLLLPASLVPCIRQRSVG